MFAVSIYIFLGWVIGAGTGVLHVCVDAEARSQLWMPFLTRCPSWFFEIQSLMGLELTVPSRLFDQQGSSCLCYPSTGISGAHNHIQLFT